MSGTSSRKINRLGIMAACGIAAAALAGCEEGGFFDMAGTAAEPGTAAVASTELVERDVEAPEVFQVSEDGLWDGRPSLGGVWVAHPDVADPERVIIRNATNGQFVIGALFRRERENPGPALQVSSDAAEALGMLAGAPAQLSVTALRREEAAPEAPGPIADFEPDFESAATVAPSAPDAVTATPLDGSGAGADPIAAAAEALANTTPQPASAASTPASSTLQRPYLQIGIFSVEANASAAAGQITGAGLAARVVPSQSQGRDFWRVIVGPAATEAARASALEQVRSLGYTDAYAIRN